MKSARKFVAEISKDYKVQNAFLFGSFASGTQHEHSDIDIAVVLDGINNKFDEMAKLYRYTRYIDLRIEPHPFHALEFKQIESPMVSQIIKTGIPIHAA